MNGIMKSLLGRLKTDHKRRSEFVASHTRNLIATQIKTIRKSRGLKQKDLADRAGIHQSQISEHENPFKGNPTIQTLVQLANTFDVGLIVRFVDFKTFVRSAANVSQAQLAIPEFNADDLEVPDSRLVAVTKTINPNKLPLTRPDTRGDQSEEFRIYLTVSGWVTLKVIKESKKKEVHSEVIPISKAA